MQAFDIHVAGKNPQSVLIYEIATAQYEELLTTLSTNMLVIELKRKCSS